MPKSRSRKKATKTSGPRLTLPIDLHMSDDDVAGVIWEAANDGTLRSRLQPIARMAAMSLGTLTAAKILLRTPPRVTGDDFNPRRVGRP